MLSKSPVAAAALAAMVSLAVVPATVQGQDCVCVTASSMTLPSEIRVLQSQEVGPFFSSDGSMLTSGAPEVVEPADDAPAGGDVLWCMSADDPRCSPRDTVPNDGFTAADAAHVASGTPARPRVGPPSLDGPGLDADRGAPRPGVRDRLERPPRR